MNKLRYWLVPALMSVVAGVHFYQVHQHGWTRWKGGGFGMYSEYHPSKKTVIFRGEGGEFIPLTEPVREAAVQVQFASGERNLERVSQRLGAELGRPIGVEVWTLQFDLDSHELTRVPIAIYYPDEFKPN
ncbi:MAG: hypothetical protein ACQKBV_04270 [Puniceicoccales bacterium]